MKQFSIHANQPAAPFILPELPFDKDAFHPDLSAETFDYHHGKHHNTYVVNLNKLIEGSEYEEDDLETIIHKTANKPEKTGIFNNAAQVWNHSFYWHSMKPNGGGAPEGELLDKINKKFGSFENFCAEFKQAGATQFGSGWAWLVIDKAGDLKILKTPNAETPITDNYYPLITCDVWEHAYYIDYRNKRPDYLAVFLDKLVNWSFASENLAQFQK